MDLYGQKSKSIPQKLTITFLELLILGFAFWIAFNKGGSVIYNWFGIEMTEGDIIRRSIIFSFSIIVFLRILFTMFFFIKRRIPLEEVISFGR